MFIKENILIIIPHVIIIGLAFGMIATNRIKARKSKFISTLLIIVELLMSSGILNGLAIASIILSDGAVEEIIYTFLLFFTATFSICYFVKYLSLEQSKIYRNIVLMFSYISSYLISTVMYTFLHLNIVFDVWNGLVAYMLVFGAFALCFKMIE